MRLVGDAIIVTFASAFPDYYKCLPLPALLTRQAARVWLNDVDTTQLFINNKNSKNYYDTNTPICICTCSGGDVARRCS